MSKRVEKHRLQVAEELSEFIEGEALPGTDVFVGIPKDAVFLLKG